MIIWQPAIQFDNLNASEINNFRTIIYPFSAYSAHNSARIA